MIISYDNPHVQEEIEKAMVKSPTVKFLVTVGPDRAGWIQHQVTANDTLIRIAKRYGIPNWRSIRDWNPHINHTTNMIRTGEWLWIKI